MTLNDLLSPTRVTMAANVGCKPSTLGLLADLAAEHTPYARGIILDALSERERLGATGIGKGVALPHIRLIGLEKMLGFFIQLKRPVDFGAIDGKPVDLVFMLLSPCQTSRDNAAAQHVQALASITRLLREPGVCDSLRTAACNASVCKVLNVTAAPARMVEAVA